MNERIQQLSEQAQQAVQFLLNSEESKRKIAMQLVGELVVQDVLDVLQKRFMGDLNREDMEVRRCIEDVKQHFGLK